MAWRSLPKQQLRARVVDVADGNGEGIGGIERLRPVAEAELKSHHLLDLLLGPRP